MPQVINTNIASLNAQRNLNASQGAANTALERLSSGLRINSAKDDAAGLAISERFQSQITGLNMAQRNANDGISLVQTAEGAMDEITNNLQRIRELSVQSANATNSISDRQALNQEVQQRIEEINRIASQTSFNGLKVLDGTFGAQTFQVSANTGETIGISGLDSRGSQLGAVISETSGFAGGTVPVPYTCAKIDLDFGAGNITGSVTIAGEVLTFNNSISDVPALAVSLQSKIDAVPALVALQLTVTGDAATGKLTVTNASGEEAPTNFNLSDGATTPETFRQTLAANGGGLGAFFAEGNSSTFDFEVGGVAFSAENVASLEDIVGQINSRSNETGVKANLDKSNTEVIFSSQVGQAFDVAINADLNGSGADDVTFHSPPP
jgi:flagellin